MKTRATTGEEALMYLLGHYTKRKDLDPKLKRKGLKFLNLIIKKMKS